MASKPVALAKLSRPRLHDVLPRERLHALLDEATRRPVAWVCAQPGAGKTALVASWLQARKRSGIWYQVDGGDADAASFVYHLRAAAQALPGKPPSGALPLLTPEYLRDLAGFGRRFARDLFARLGEGGTLVLDNLQEVPDDAAAFQRLVLELAQQVPAGISVIVVSRAEPSAAFATLLADDAIAVIDGAALRFTRGETEAVALKRGLAAPDVEHLHARSDGWAAGLTLLLARRGPRAAGAVEDDAESLQHVFGYFAQRVFDDLRPELQQALQQLAFLPQMTAELAAGLTGLDDAARLLDQFYRRHLFTDRRRVGTRQPVQVYQFHALFRTFLQHRAKTTWDPARLRELCARAGCLLAAAGQGEEALPLLAAGGEWGAYATVVRDNVDGAIVAGRRQTVNEWLDAMPAAERDRDPWLGYWQHRALVLSAPERGLAILQASFERFGRDGDAAGQLACGAAAMQMLWYTRLGWSEIGPWLDRIEHLLDRPVAFPTRAVELASYAVLHAALAFCRLGHPAIGPMGRRLLALVDDDTLDWTLRLTTATHLMTFFHNSGQDDLVRQLMGKVDPVVDVLPATALARSFWYTFRAIHDMRNARDAEATARFQQAEELARAEGLAYAEFAALQFRTYLDNVFRRTEQAEARLARMAQHPARANPDAEMNYWLANVLLAQARGDATAAHGHALRALPAIDAVGAAYFRANFRPLVASAFADVGAYGEALALVAGAREQVQGTYLEVMETQFLLEEAYVFHLRGDAQAARERLALALPLALTGSGEHAYAQRVLSRNRTLLELALAAGIETEFVRRTIRMWRHPPPAADIAGWPWPIRVRTLGGFEVQVDDAPIEFGRKAPKKTLALLKAVVARGGSAPEAALVDTFWADEQGDAAAKSLGAAVHRLRGLLGDGDAVVQQGGLVSLDRSRVWVDAWAFERSLERPRGAPAIDAEAAARVLALYRGAFLAEEEGESWPVATRERLRSKFIQAVATHAAQLEAQKRHEEAIDWYLRGLDADSVVEPFYQGLMRCYHRLDRMPEAVSAYRRLKQTLSVTLSLPPSAATEKLYQSLRLSNP